jgi:hypothetical protein
MKTTFPVAITIAAIVIALSSCWLFGKNKNADDEKTIVGKWIVDSVVDKSIHSEGFFFNPIEFVHDSVAFNDDNSFRLSDAKDSTLNGNYIIDSSKENLLIVADGDSIKLKISYNRSSALLLSADSVSFVLNKQ